MPWRSSHGPVSHCNTPSAAVAPPLQVLAVPQPLREGATEQQVYLLLPRADAEGAPQPAAAVLPDTSAAREAAAAAASSMSFWRADSTTGAVLAIKQRSP